MNQGFCDHCYSWGVILDPDRNMCVDCKEREIGAQMRAKRLANESVRALSERNARGRS